MSFNLFWDWLSHFHMIMPFKKIYSWLLPLFNPLHFLFCFNFYWHILFLHHLHFPTHPSFFTFLESHPLLQRTQKRKERNNSVTHRSRMTLHAIFHTDSHSTSTKREGGWNLISFFEAKLWFCSTQFLLLYFPFPLLWLWLLLLCLLVSWFCLLQFAFVHMFFHASFYLSYMSFLTVQSYSVPFITTVYLVISRSMGIYFISSSLLHKKCYCEVRGWIYAWRAIWKMLQR